MLSCGRTGKDRKADIENILGVDNYTSSSGDDHFCPPCAGSAEEVELEKNPFLSIWSDTSDTTVATEDTTTAFNDTIHGRSLEQMLLSPHPPHFVAWRPSAKCYMVMSAN